MKMSSLIWAGMEARKSLYSAVYMLEGVNSLMTLPSERRSERMERWCALSLALSTKR